MKKAWFVVAICLCSLMGRAQNIPAYHIEDVLAGAASADTIYIINFWATWCAPCVQELPEFGILNDRYKTQPVKIILVSLDFKTDYPMKLQGFIQRKRIDLEVAWLADTDPNVFIPKVDERWEGSIPATLILQPGKIRKFIEGQITAGKISKLIDGMLTDK
jgi:thiol-disulfide isomerase/thioredoxin